MIYTSHMSELLDIVNEHDEVIGQAERDEVHRLGLVCRLVYVCFYTPDGQIILQKRSNTKKNDAGKLTTAVSGHVASGQSYLDAAVREAFEETGVEINMDNLTNLGTVRSDYTQGSYVSNAVRGLFAYKFDGSIDDLVVEDGDGDGFVTLSINEFEKQIATQPDKFAVIITSTVGQMIIEGIKKLI